MKKSKTYIATPPGFTVKEQLEIRGMSQKEFARRMNMSEKHISKFLNGEVLLTSDMAFRLEMVLGLPSSFWEKLESIYRNKLLLVKQENDMEEEMKLLKRFPYKEMVKLGWIKECENDFETVIELRKFFEVVSLKLVELDTDEALSAFYQKAILESRSINIGTIDKDEIKKDIPTLIHDVDNIEELKETLKKLGIVLVVLPCIKKDKNYSVSFKDNNKIIIGLTDCDKEKLCLNLLKELKGLSKYAQ